MCDEGLESSHVPSQRGVVWPPSHTLSEPGFGSTETDPASSHSRRWSLLEEAVRSRKAAEADEDCEEQPLRISP